MSTVGGYGSVLCTVGWETAAWNGFTSPTGHEVRDDQPLAGGGTDEAPSPVQLFVVSLATCVAYFAGQHLPRHGVTRAGLVVHAEYRKPDRPSAHVASIHLQLIVPAGLPRTVATCFVPVLCFTTTVVADPSSRRDSKALREVQLGQSSLIGRLGLFSQ